MITAKIDRDDMARKKNTFKKKIKCNKTKQLWKRNKCPNTATIGKK